MRFRERESNYSEPGKIRLTVEAVDDYVLGSYRESDMSIVPRVSVPNPYVAMPGHTSVEGRYDECQQPPCLIFQGSN